MKETEAVDQNLIDLIKSKPALQRSLLWVIIKNMMGTLNPKDMWIEGITKTKKKLHNFVHSLYSAIIHMIRVTVTTGSIPISSFWMIVKNQGYPDYYQAHILLTNLLNSLLTEDILRQYPRAEILTSAILRAESNRKIDSSTLDEFYLLHQYIHTMYRPSPINKVTVNLTN